MKLHRYLAILIALVFLSLAQAATANQAIPTLQLLKDLIAINTTNPPGNEIAAVRYVEKYLRQFDIPSQIIEAAPGRGNLIAKLKGNGQKKSLLLLAHLDVVTADPKEWKHPPFQGTEDNGYLYGRGALDMKGQAALMINTFVQLKLQKIPLTGDVLLVLVADEEAGGKYGAEYLVKNHWAELNPGVVINEGSVGLIKDKLHLYPIQVAEKGVAWLQLTAAGTSGHGSMPIPDNASLKLVNAVEKLGRYREPIQKTAIVEAMLDRLAEHFSFPKSFLIRNFFTFPIKQLAPIIAGSKIERDKIFNSMVHNTVVPTVLKAGSKTNVIPATAIAKIDCRILPGVSPKEFRDKLKKLINDPSVEVKLLVENQANESKFDTPAFRALEKAILKQDPKGIVFPLISPGATDNRFFRERGILAYGIIPILISMEDLSGLHGKDERIPIAGLATGQQILFDFVRNLRGVKER